MFIDDNYCIGIKENAKTIVCSNCSYVDNSQKAYEEGRNRIKLRSIWFAICPKCGNENQYANI